jgi:Flp pilus assembly protein TadB
MANTYPERSTGDILQNVVADVGDIVRGEIRLAKAEIRQKAGKAGKAGGMLGGAAICGLFAAACLVVTCIAALALVMGVWLAALIMFVLLGGAGAGLYAVGRERLRRIEPVPEITVQTAKDTLQWAKHRTT